MSVTFHTPPPLDSILSPTLTISSLSAQSSNGTRNAPEAFPELRSKCSLQSLLHPPPRQLLRPPTCVTWHRAPHLALRPHTAGHTGTGSVVHGSLHVHLVPGTAMARPRAHEESQRMMATKLDTVPSIDTQ